jgi:hypothetical protein
VPEIEPRVDEEKLRLLLSEGHESAQLDYKSHCDLRDRRELTAIAKDIGAMAALGGYIVIGADNSGQPTGELEAEHVAVFDQAILQGKLRRYLPESVEVRSAARELDGAVLVVIYVAAHPDGFVVFEADGAYKHTDGRDRFEFRAGEVLVRHGTASERWTQADIARIRQGLRERERERWRLEFREDFAATLGTATAARQVADAPAAMLDWRLDEQTLTGALIEQIRRNDPLPLELLLMRLPGEARAAIDADDRETLGVVTDRLAAITATLLLTRRPELFDAGITALVATYNAGFDRRGFPCGAATPPEIIWLAVIERVLGIGAFAVRRRDWNAVRTLALQTGTGEDFTGGRYKTWLRHALTMAARAELVGDRPGRGGESVSLLNLALQHVNRLPALRPDLPEGDEEMLSSLCQFDMFGCLATLARGGGIRDTYPNFSRFWSQRSDPASSPCSTTLRRAPRSSRARTTSSPPPCARSARPPGPRAGGTTAGPTTRTTASTRSSTSTPPRPSSDAAAARSRPGLLPTRRRARSRPRPSAP